jgi:trk system potassium uptake protein TrkH
LLGGFVLLTVLGAFVLSWPIANSNGQWQSFLDASFMASSAVSTTGLGVVSTASDYTFFGQIVLLILFQVGGLGYMTLIVFLIHMLGQKLSFRGGALMQESLAGPSRGEMRTFVRRVVLFTAVFEGIGVIALTLHDWGHDSVWHILYQAVFHAVSAFCTAGFSLFDDGFIRYQNDWYFNIVITVISIGGAVGFYVLNEAYVVFRQLLRRQHKRPLRLSSHSRLALIVLGGMIVVGTTVLYLAEGDYSANGFLYALFQSSTAASTTGFNTVDVGHMSDTSLAMMSVLMFIGSPTGGTGGGIKSTTFGVILLFLWATLKNDRQINIGGRRLSTPTLVKSVAVAITAVLWLALITIILTATEHFSLMPILFEATSALGTVGNSMGITPDLSEVGKVILTITMLIGRVGPLTVAFSVFGFQAESSAYRYPEEEVFVG